MQLQFDDFKHTPKIHTDYCASVHHPGESRVTRRQKYTRLCQDLSSGLMFYIGIAALPKGRWENPPAGHKFRFDDMYLLAYGESKTNGADEDFLICQAWLHDHAGRNLNQQRGTCGQGKWGQLGFLYLCTKKKEDDDNDNRPSIFRRKFLRDSVGKCLY